MVHIIWISYDIQEAHGPHFSSKKHLSVEYLNPLAIQFLELISKLNLGGHTVWQITQINIKVLVHVYYRVPV